MDPFPHKSTIQIHPPAGKEFLFSPPGPSLQARPHGSGGPRAGPREQPGSQGPPAELEPCEGERTDCGQWVSIDGRRELILAQQVPVEILASGEPTFLLEVELETRVDWQ